MKKCVLCKTRFQKGREVTFHKFPSDKRRLEIWLKNIAKPGWRPKNNKLICSKHFSDDCFIKHTSCKNALKKGSIPTIFCSSAENNSSSHESMVLPTPETIKVIPALSVPETIAVDVKRTIIMDQNDTNLSYRKRKTSSYDPHQSIASKKARSNLGSSPSTHEKMVSPPPSVSRTTMVTPITFVSEKISVQVQRRLTMEENNNNLTCRRRRSKCCDPQQSIPSKKVRSYLEVCDNIKHDHRYENTPKSSKKELQRVRQSIKKSRVRAKVLSQHVKRLKVNVSSLRTIISELKKKKNIGDDCADMLNQYDDFKPQLLKRMSLNTSG